MSRPGALQKPCKNNQNFSCGTLALALGNGEATLSIERNPSLKLQFDVESILAAATLSHAIFPATQAFFNRSISDA